MSTAVFVASLSWSTSSDSLRQRFSEYGQVVDAFIMRDADTGRSKGNGFFTFSRSFEAEAAIAGLNEQELDGRKIQVRFASETELTEAFSAGGE